MILNWSSRETPSQFCIKIPDSLGLTSGLVFDDVCFVEDDTPPKLLVQGTMALSEKFS